MQFRWHGPEFASAFNKEKEKRLHRATMYLANRVKQSISTKVKVGQDGKRVRSDVGNPPFLETGTLRGSIATEVVGDVGRVGSNLVYSKYLENPDETNRPFLAPALEKNQDQIARIIAGEKMKL